jgi:RNA polymerase sigma-70 factor (ECF subfamily)
VNLARPLPESAALALAHAAAAGDVAAVQRLVAAVTPRVTRVVHAVLGASHAEADDAVQQALIGFVDSLGDFRGECEPVHFASRIAVRAAVAFARRASRARGRRADDVDLETLATPYDAGTTTPTEATAERLRLRAALRELLTRIPAEQAEAMALRFVLGSSLDEIARITDVPSNTVRSRIRLAKKALRAAIEADPRLSEELGATSRCDAKP